MAGGLVRGHDTPSLTKFLGPRGYTKCLEGRGSSFSHHMSVALLKDVGYEGPSAFGPRKEHWQDVGAPQP